MNNINAYYFCAQTISFVDRSPLKELQKLFIKPIKKVNNSKMYKKKFKNR